MTTSFSMTRTAIAQRALGKILKLGTRTVASADADIAYEAIDLRLKEMHKLGTFWRKVTTVPVTFSLSASIATASAGAGDILFPMHCVFVNGSLDDPVEIIDIQEYAAIQDKTYQGNPEKVLWKGGSELIFWPVPLSDGTAKLTYEKIADDTSAGAAVDVEVSMIRSLIDIVKYDLADNYGVPEQIQVRWKLEAREAERDIRKLGAQRVDLATVQVEDWPDEATGIRRDWRTG